MAKQEVCCAVIKYSDHFIYPILWHSKRNRVSAICMKDNEWKGACKWVRVRGNFQFSFDYVRAIKCKWKKNKQKTRQNIVTQIIWNQ